MASFGLQQRDFDDEDDSMNGLLFAFFVLFLFACLTSITMLYIRRRRAAQQAAILPTHQRRGHERSLTISTTPCVGQDKIYVYDEKMNLIANSHGPPDGPVPEIRVTFPDEMDQQSGQKMAGRVVVVRIADSGSIGMEPLQQEQLPPYQRSDANQFQSLELERLGGLREGGQPVGQPRWS